MFLDYYQLAWGNLWIFFFNFDRFWDNNAKSENCPQPIFLSNFFFKLIWNSSYTFSWYQHFFLVQIFFGFRFLVIFAMIILFARILTTIFVISASNYFSTRTIKTISVRRSSEPQLHFFSKQNFYFNKEKIIKFFFK